ncbi:hypothetical protein [Actinoplanes sp. NPDC051859]|uniref:hypothetical protein n=1 Tax=Actinoplanes sp. NPDC051859 TaxID=3363909 RepID=UPI0037961C8E
MSTDEAETPEEHRARLAARQHAQFDLMAENAEAIARVADESATIHDQIGDHLPSAAAHADRDRQLAAAERAAAAAFRERELPSPEVRAAIRNARPGPEELAQLRNTTEKPDR